MKINSEISKVSSGIIQRVSRASTPPSSGQLRQLTQDVVEISPPSSSKPHQLWDPLERLFPEHQGLNKERVKVRVEKFIDDATAAKDYVRNVFSDDVLRQYGLNPEEIEVQFRIKDKNGALKKVMEPVEEKVQLAQFILETREPQGVKELRAALDAADERTVSAHEELRDVVGLRFILKDPSPENINKFADMLVDMHKKQQLNLTKLTLYGGKDSYMTGAGYRKFRDVLPKEKVKSKYRNNGYITSQGNAVINTPLNGEIVPVRLEWQIRGEKMHKFAEKEHDITYKDGPLQPVLASLDAKKKEEYIQYVKKGYQHIRDTETGKAGTKPQLPEGIPQELSYDDVL